MPFSYSTVVIEKYKLDILMEVIDKFENSFSTHIESMKMTYEENYLTLLINSCGKTILTVREVLILSANGYADGALSLSRNIFEQMMTIAYFQRHLNDERFADDVKYYFIDYTLKRNKALIYYYQESGICQDKVSQLQAEINSIKNEVTRKASNDYWWSAHSSFSNLVKSFIETEDDSNFKALLSKFFLIYKRACVTIHANSMGNAIRLGTDSSFWIVDTSPTESGHGCPLWFSTFCLLYIFGIICNVFSMDFEPYKTTLNQLLFFSMKNLVKKTCKKPISVINEHCNI